MEILNYINNEWVKPNVTEYLDVVNPATGQVIAKTPLGTKANVESAAKAAREAFDGWRRTPVNDRVQYLFKLRDLMRANHDEIAKLITNEAGKTFEEAKAEMVRAFENIEVACGMPSLMISHSSVTPDLALTRARTVSPRRSTSSPDAPLSLMRKLQCISETFAPPTR